MSQDFVHSLQKQNRLLKLALGLGSLGLTTALLVAAASPSGRAHFAEIDAERINIVGADGKRQLVIASRDRLPGIVQDGKEAPDHRHMPGFIFYNAVGDECGGLIWDGKLDAKGNPASGMHFSMDRFGGDQQLALGNYEDHGSMESGLNVFDCATSKEAEAWKARYSKANGPEKLALRQKLTEGVLQTQRVFVGKTRGRSSAVILADAKGHPRIMMLVTPEGEPSLQFLDEKGATTASFPNGK